MSDGWKCPVCGRGVAPDEKHCDHGGSGQSTKWIWPPPPPPSPPPRDIPVPQLPGAHDDGRMSICGCKLGTVCASTACPHRSEITCSTAKFRFDNFTWTDSHAGRA